MGAHREGRLSGYLNRLPIRKKMLLSGVVGILASSLILSAVLIIQSYEAMLDKTISLSRAALERAGVGVEQRLAAQRNALDSVKGYTPLYDYLDATYENGYAYYGAFTRLVYPGLKMITDSLGDMRIRIFSHGEAGAFSGATSGRLEDLKRLDWFDAKRPQTAGCVWQMSRFVMDGELQQVLVCYLTLRWRSGAPDRVAAVFLGEHSLRELVSAQGEEVFLLLDEERRVVTSSRDDCVGLTEDELRERFGLALNWTEGDATFAGESVRVLSQPMDLKRQGASGWRMVSLVPYRRIFRDVRDMIVRSVLLTAAILAASVAFSLVISRGMTRRLSLLMRKIGTTASGEFRVDVVVGGADEIAQISLRFDDMVERIARLIGDNERMYKALIERSNAEQELALRQRDAELAALRAQINPHFLFNTLETIRMNLLLRGDRETAGVMLAFSENIREYMDLTRGTAVLEDELNSLRKYVSILEYRFHERLRFEMDVDESLNAQVLPRLMLQPLVENAVRHGIESKTDGGCIRLSAWLDGDSLMLRVGDDGLGMEQEELEKLRLSLEAPHRAGGITQLGLRNVHRRIRLIYGDAYGLTVESRAGVGTEVTLRLRAGELSMSANGVGVNDKVL